MAKCLQKPSRRRHADLKDRMKERNKKWTRLGKAYEPMAGHASCITSGPVCLKSIQANNRALALALQEKCKVRAAQDACRCLKGENQCLKLQVFYLQRLLESQQMQAPAENKRMFLAVTIPVVTGPERSLGLPQCIVKLEEIPGSEMKATTDDSKPAGFVSEDSCESATADAIKEGERECDKEIYWSFLPPQGASRRRT